MKKLFKILLSSGLMTGMSSIAFATETTLTETSAESTGMSLKPVFFIVLVLVIIGILYLSFKLDTPSSGKTKKKTKKSMNEQKVTNNLVEKDVTYEAEAKETYVDENIAPVKVEDDEDEVSLFESYSNPDTLPEEEVSEYDDNDVLGKLDSLDEEDDFEKKEETEESEPEETSYDLNGSSDLDGDGDETNDFTSGEEETDGDGDNSIDNFDLNNNGIDDAEETLEEDPETFSETMVFDSYDLNSDEKETEEEEIEEVEEVDEEPEEEEEENLYNIPKPEEDSDFGGFTTLKRNSVASPRFSPKGTGSTAKEEKEEVKKEVKKTSKAATKEDDSASMFLKQMEANLSGEEAAPKKTATKKAATAKKETKTTTKKAATKKTTTTKKSTKK